MSESEAQKVNQTHIG